VVVLEGLSFAEDESVELEWVVVDELEDCDCVLSEGVLVELGVLVVDDDSGIVCVVVDSAMRVCSCTVRC
jgi:hypothetical protein